MKVPELKMLLNEVPFVPPGFAAEHELFPGVQPGNDNRKSGNV